MTLTNVEWDVAPGHPLPRNHAQDRRNDDVMRGVDDTVQDTNRRIWTGPFVVVPTWAWPISVTVEFARPITFVSAAISSASARVSG